MFNLKEVLQNIEELRLSLPAMGLIIITCAVIVALLGFMDQFIVFVILLGLLLFFVFIILTVFIFVLKMQKRLLDTILKRV